MKGGRIMQQEKMGRLLRELRKEKAMTQEQMAELFGVTNRTISRWENGINMPDVSILVEMSSYFEVSIQELIEGERKDESMVTENNGDLEILANYADEQKRVSLKKVHHTDVIGLVACLLSGITLEAYRISNANIWLLLQSVLLGIVGGILSWNMLHASGIDDLLKQNKKKHRCMLYVELLLVVLVLFSACRDAYLFLTGM